VKLTEAQYAAIRKGDMVHAYGKDHVILSDTTESLTLWGGPVLPSEQGGHGRSRPILRLDIVRICLEGGQADASA
jgi:hypothetical protein